MLRGQKEEEKENVKCIECWAPRKDSSEKMTFGGPEENEGYIHANI